MHDGAAGSIQVPSVSMENASHDKSSLMRMYHNKYWQYYEVLLDNGLPARDQSVVATFCLALSMLFSFAGFFQPSS